MKNEIMNVDTNIKGGTLPSCDFPSTLGPNNSLGWSSLKFIVYVPSSIYNDFIT